MMAAITPMRAQLSRFEDVMVSSLSQRSAGVNGLGLGYDNGDGYEYYNGGGNTGGNTTYYGPEYSDDNGVPWSGSGSTGSGSTGSGSESGSESGSDTKAGSGIFETIFGTGNKPKTEYTLPDGSKVTYSNAKPRPKPNNQLITGVPNSYLLIGGAVLVVLMLAGRR